RRTTAGPVHWRASSALESEDLLQIGMVALVEAATGFEDRGHGFASYAQMRVRGAMIDHLRRHATICRSAMARRKVLMEARRVLEQRNGRAPTAAEVAAHLELDGPADRELVDGTEAAQHKSIDDAFSDQSIWFADCNSRAVPILELVS